MKNPIDRLNWPAKAVVLGLGAVAIVACEKRLDSAGKPDENKQVASSSAVVVGTTPAEPTPPLGALPQTTSSADASKELTQGEESKAMPLPGQPNDHSSLAPDASQRAGQQDPLNQPPRAATQ